MEFNEDIYHDITNIKDLKEEIDNLIINANNDLLVVLRLHLMCENVLEGWICASTNRKSLFIHPTKLSLSFKQKLDLSYNLNLPRPAYQFFSEINQIRNKFAHNLKTKNLASPLLSKLESFISQILPDSPIHMEISEGDKVLHSMDKPSTPDRIKLCMLFMVFLFKLTISRVPTDGSDKSGRSARISFPLGAAPMQKVSTELGSALSTAEETS